MKTTKTETKAKFQTQFEKKRKVTCWIRLIYFIVIVAPFLYMITTTNVWFVVFLSAATFLVSGWVWAITNNIKFRPRDCIRDMKVELKIWSDRIIYLNDLRQISLEEIHKMRNFLDEETVKAERQTAIDEIMICEKNIQANSRKIDYLVDVSPFWQYFISWRWLKKTVIIGKQFTKKQNIMKKKIIKPKILLIGWENFLTKAMLTNELKQLKKRFKIIFASESAVALIEIAKAKLLEKNPIHGFVFKRSMLVGHSPECKVISELASFCASKQPVLINMISNDQDSEARSKAVSAHYCKTEDWEQVGTILDGNL